jgi:hypothetical protein
MIIYRFRITSEEQEDFIREIEIQPTQTFLDFHEVIQSSADLDMCDKAFFYTTDRKYKKHQEISFKPQKKKLKKYDDELDEIITEEFELHLMKNSRLKNFIEDPHQKMIYEYFGKEFHAFHIELFKLLKIEDDILLPRCIRKTGNLPKKAEIAAIADEEPEPEEVPGLILQIPPAKEAMLAGLEENEAELADIESHLQEFLGEEEQHPESLADAGGEYHPEDEDIIESVGDFDDLENIETKQREYENDTDDY